MAVILVQLAYAQVAVSVRRAVGGLRAIQPYTGIIKPALISKNSIATAIHDRLINIVVKAEYRKMAQRSARDAKRKKNGKKATAPILRRSENEADNPSERDARAERASTRASAREESAREVAGMLMPADLPERDLNDLSPLTLPTRTTNDGRTSINGSNDLRDRRSQISTDDHYRSTVGTTEHRDRRHHNDSQSGSQHGTNRSQHTAGRSERSGMQSGGRTNASAYDSRRTSGPDRPGPLRELEIATVDHRSPVTGDQILAWDLESRTLVNVTLPYIDVNGRTLEWDDRTNRLQITKPSNADIGTTTMPTSIAPIDRSTPTSEPVEDRTRATRWLQETDQSINMALRRLAEPTPEVGETASEHRSRRAAHSRIQDISDDIKDAEREHRERRARLTRATESLVKEEEEVAHRMRGLTDEQSRTQDRDRTAHYLDWLNSQAVLDRMREADVQQSGHSGIPPCEKRAGYPGMNRLDGSTGVAPAPGGDGPPSEPDDEEDSSSADESRRSHHTGRMGNPDRPSHRMTASRGRHREPLRRTGQERPPSDPSSPSSEPTDSSSSDEPAPIRRRHDDSRESSRRREHTPMNPGRDYREQTAPRQNAPGHMPRQPAPARAGTVDPSMLLTLHEEVMINRYRELGRQRVGQTNNLFVEVRGIKVNTPKSYDGTDDVSMFEEWLNVVLRTLRVINMCGPAKDAQCIDYCGIVLSGQASMWFQDEVESPLCHHPEWEFEDVICAIFKQFIHDVTAQTAETQYKAIMYDPLKGALAVYNEMKRISRRMAEIPNEYAFKSSFIKRLPWEIVEPLRRYRRVSAETTPLDILLQHVKEVDGTVLGCTAH
ncbi:hypothetical protein FIBSPDRAFT_894370 [Athelia psychrophila]|uniref:Uncharacterized protein n=1 Tax=Athelia psychrophila TaxID=1759441 RepID=A0A166FWY2_9AGAM|nr:hypothetical protein FIBSPDRAFT_894370 [Fibularhizoctonia sp. CBS 109695]